MHNNLENNSKKNDRNIHDASGVSFESASKPEFIDNRVEMTEMAVLQAMLNTNLDNPKVIQRKLSSDDVDELASYLAKSYYTDPENDPPQEFQDEVWIYLCENYDSYEEAKESIFDVETLLRPNVDDDEKEQEPVFPYKIEVSGDTIYAYDGLEQIAEFEFVDYDGVYWIYNVETNKAYQGKGVGSEIIRVAVETWGAVYASSASKMEHEQYDEDDTRYVSEEGAALVNSCIRKGIMNKEWFINPFFGADDFEDEDEF